MSKIQLQINNAKLEALITELQGKAAGGGSGSGLEYESISAFTYTVDDVSGASYGFALGSDGYYESENKGKRNTYALCRVNFTVQMPCDITFDIVCLDPRSSGYGIMGLLNTALKASLEEDTNCKMRVMESSPQSVVYANVPAGNYFIDIKHFNGPSYCDENACFRFKVQAAPTITRLTEASLQLIRESDTDLVATNIKSGVDIFGVTGTYEGVGGSIGTCAVTVDGNAGTDLMAIATIVNQETGCAEYGVAYTGESINNVVCGSVIAVYLPSADENTGLVCDGGCENTGTLGSDQHYIVFAPATSGSNGWISVEYYE